MEREQRLICCDGNSANASGDRSSAVFTAKTVLVRKLDRLRVVFVDCQFREIEPPRHAFLPLPLQGERTKVRGFRAHPLVQLPCRQTLTLPLSLQGRGDPCAAAYPTPQRRELTIDQHYLDSERRSFLRCVFIRDLIVRTHDESCEHAGWPHHKS